MTEFIIFFLPLAQRPSVPTRAGAEHAAYTHPPSTFQT